MTKNDKQIIDSLLSDDYFAEDYLYKKVYPYVENFVLKNHYSKEDAEDIFQDCIMILVHKVRTDFELSCSITTYIFSIAKKMLMKKMFKDNAMCKAFKNVEYLMANDVQTEVNMEEDDDNQLLKKQILNDHFNQMDVQEKEILMKTTSENRRDRWRFKKRLKKAILNDPRFRFLNIRNRDR